MTYMLFKLVSEELVTLSFKDFINVSSLVEEMAGGCGVFCGGGSTTCKTN